MNMKIIAHPSEILYDMIKSFVDSYPKDVQRAVYRFAELDGVNRPDSCRLGRIREDVKKKLFPNSWRSSTSFFMCKTVIKFMIPNIIVNKNDFQIVQLT